MSLKKSLSRKEMNRTKQKYPLAKERKSIKKPQRPEGFPIVGIGASAGGLLFGYGILPYFRAHPLDLSIGLVSLNTDPVTITVAVWGMVIAALFAGILPVLNITHQSIIKAIWGN